MAECEKLKIQWLHKIRSCPAVLLCPDTDLVRLSIQGLQIKEGSNIIPLGLRAWLGDGQMSKSQTSGLQFPFWLLWSLITWLRGARTKWRKGCCKAENDRSEEWDISVTPTWKQITRHWLGAVRWEEKAHLHPGAKNAQLQRDLKNVYARAWGSGPNSKKTARQMRPKEA